MARMVSSTSSDAQMRAAASRTIRSGFCPSITDGSSLFVPASSRNHRRMGGRSEARGGTAGCRRGHYGYRRSMADPPQSAPRRARIAKAGRFGLMLGALGVVFGDIGTSPLYALQTVFSLDGAW